MPQSTLPRRRFLQGMLAGTSAMLASGKLVGQETETAPPRDEYRGPNVIVVRFGGGARRRETIDPEHTYSPFLCHDFAQRGTLYPKMEIITAPGIETSHGQGTLYILTGKYAHYKDFEGQFLGARFEAEVPTLFEYFRKAYAVPEHQTLIINGEDRTDEEFYSFSNHHLFGVRYRSNVLSLYRFKTYLLKRQIEQENWTEEELAQKRRKLAKLESLDYRWTETGQSPEIEAFWERWRRYYGETGLVNPRGDRLLTELAVRALGELRPRLMMINYNDCDYVHWGNLTHYTRGVAIMDVGLKRLVETVEADPEYRDNTIFVVVPDCGRDNNRFVAVPCQHHFGSRSSHEIFALFVGPGIPSGRVVDRKVDQISVAATVAQHMGFAAPYTEGAILAEAVA